MAALIAVLTAFEVGKSSLALVTEVTTPLAAAAEGVSPRAVVIVAAVIACTWFHAAYGVPAAVVPALDVVAIFFAAVVPAA